jgi:hypothetical protein
VVNKKNFLFDWKFFFNFRKMVYCFETASHSQIDEPCWDLTETHSRLARNSPRTPPGLVWDLTEPTQDPIETWLGPYQDLPKISLRLDWNSPKTWVRRNRTCPGPDCNLPGLAWDLPETWLRPARDLTDTWLWLI